SFPNKASTITPVIMSIIMDKPDPLGPKGSKKPSTAFFASVVCFPSFVIAQPSGISSLFFAAKFIFPRATLLVAMSKITGFLFVGTAIDKGLVPKVGSFDPQGTINGEAFDNAIPIQLFAAAIFVK